MITTTKILDKSIHGVIPHVYGQILPRLVMLECTKFTHNTIPFETWPTSTTVWKIIATYIINFIRCPLTRLIYPWLTWWSFNAQYQLPQVLRNLSSPWCKWVLLQSPLNSIFHPAHRYFPCFVLDAYPPSDFSQHLIFSNFNFSQWCRRKWQRSFFWIATPIRLDHLFK